MNASDAYCRQKAAPPGSNLYYALLMTPPARRAAACALHALCQEIAEVKDEVHEPSVASAKLAWWRTEIAALCAGRPTHPASKALLPHLENTGISQSALLQLVDGAEMDFEQMRYLDLPALDRYCRLNGGQPASLAAHLYGFSDAQTPSRAEALGQAMALARIVANVGADARRGYIYFPVDELQRFDVTAAAIQNGGYSGQFKSLMRHQTQRAREQLQAAQAALPAADRRRQRALLVLAQLHLALLDEIELSQFEILHQRIDLTPLRKLWIAWRTR